MAGWSQRYPSIGRQHPCAVLPTWFERQSKHIQAMWTCMHMECRVTAAGKHVLSIASGCRQAMRTDRRPARYLVVRMRAVGLIISQLQLAVDISHDGRSTDLEDRRSIGILQVRQVCEGWSAFCRWRCYHACWLIAFRAPRGAPRHIGRVPNTSCVSGALLRSGWHIRAATYVTTGTRKRSAF